jgi:hypothetical protein
MDILLSSVTDKEINRTFSIPFCSKYTRQARHYNKKLVNKAIDTIAGDYLIHWTRTSFRPWPAETLHNYYDSILSSEVFPRSAYATLNTILSSHTIIASPRHMPLNSKCVSFTGKSPSAFLEHMRWRSRYSEMSFEPYGIGIRKNSAFHYGIQKVIYDNESHCTHLRDRWIYQSCGTKGDWESEDEYRCLGDVNLLHICHSDIIAICQFESEAESISSRHGIETINFFCQVDETNPAS